MTRAFVAIGLPDALRDGIAALQDRLPVGRPVDPDGLHLTLAFLGKCTDAELEEVHETLSGIAEPGFPLRLSGLGTFGGARPRAVWLDVVPEPRLVALQRAVVRAVRRAGLDVPARRFMPHVTLARFRKGYAEDAAFTRFAAAHAGAAFDPFFVSEIGLYESFLTSDGARYEVLGSYPLAVVTS